MVHLEQLLDPLLFKYSKQKRPKSFCNAISSVTVAILDDL